MLKEQGLRVSIEAPGAVFKVRRRGSSGWLVGEVEFLLLFRRRTKAASRGGGANGLQEVTSRQDDQDGVLDSFRSPTLLLGRASTSGLNDLGLFNGFEIEPDSPIRSVDLGI